MLVLLDGGLSPLLALLGEVVVSQEWYCKGNVGLGRCQISVVKCFVDNVQGAAATWLFEIGGHTSDGHTLLGQCGGRCEVVWLLQKRPECAW